MANIVPCRISQPHYLQVKAGAFGSQMISLREHIPSTPDTDPELPLVLLTLHPGYSAGSYENRDYFELLAPLLFAACTGRFRLRIYTVNHPGHDLPPESKIHRFRMGHYSIKEQPAVIVRALRWLLQHEFTTEDPISLVAYGHSMGGLALAQSDLQQLALDMVHQGRRTQIKKVLSAPAILLSREARRILRPLDALHALKHSLGHLPYYDRVATSLYRSLGPPLHRLSSNTYSLTPDDTFLNFEGQNPFLLLKQGRELLQQPARQKLPALLDGTDLFVYSGDRMVDSPALLRAAGYAQKQGTAVTVHIVKSKHTAERENPQAVAEKLQEIMQEMLAD